MKFALICLMAALINIPFFPSPINIGAFTFCLFMGIICLWVSEGD